MTRPAYLSYSERLPLSRAETLAYEKSWREWWQSPEGKAEIAEREAAEAKRLEDLRPKYIRHVLEQAGVPGRALDVLAAETRETVALAAARGAEDLLVLLGAPGTGKTVGAAARLHAYVAEPKHWSAENRDDLTGCYSERKLPHFSGHEPIWVTAGQLARLDHYDQAGVDRIAKARLLVIDDLGAEYQDAKGFFASLLDEIIDARYSGMLATIITSNLDASAFAARYGARIVDRIREAGRMVGCGAQSLRGKDRA